MVSTLKLTKIQIPNSDSDVLSFNSSTGVMTFHKDIQGEGTNTTNLQQGLLKVWIAIDQGGTMSTLDSFNIASITDDGTGKSDTNFTTNMSSANYFNSVTAGNSNNRRAHFFSPSTTQLQIEIHSFSSGISDADASYVCGGVAGDLA